METSTIQIVKSSSSPAARYVAFFYFISGVSFMKLHDTYPSKYLEFNKNVICFGEEHKKILPPQICFIKKKRKKEKSHLKFMTKLRLVLVKQEKHGTQQE